MSKKLGIIVLGIGGLLLVIGIILVSVNAIKGEPPTKNKEQVEEYIPDVDKNESEKLKEKHCLENICIDTLSVITDNDAKLSIVSGDLKNTSNQVIPAGYFKIVFTVGTETFDKMIYHGEIPANGVHPLEWQHNNEKLTQAPDYQLVKPTEAEIQAENQKQATLQTKES